MDNFEQNLRKEICNAALALSKSGLRFAVFSNTECNEQYWIRTSNGGWRTSTRMPPAADSATTFAPANAIRDIYTNGYKYATECATAMEIVYYKALLEVYGEELFNRTFTSIYLMDWDIRDPLLMKVGYMEDLSGGRLPPLQAGDRAYFANPDHSPDLPQWQGENVIVLENDRYYGHGIGVASAERIIASLNSRRGGDNPRSAYLMNSAGRPDFIRLGKVMEANVAVSVWREFPQAVAVMRVEGGSGTRFV